MRPAAVLRRAAAVAGPPIVVHPYTTARVQPAVHDKGRSSSLPNLARWRATPPGPTSGRGPTLAGMATTTRHTRLRGSTQKNGAETGTCGSRRPLCPRGFRVLAAPTSLPQVSPDSGDAQLYCTQRAGLHHGVSPLAAGAHTQPFFGLGSCAVTPSARDARARDPRSRAQEHILSSHTLLPTNVRG